MLQRWKPEEPGIEEPGVQYKEGSLEEEREVCGVVRERELVNFAEMESRRSVKVMLGAFIVNCGF